MHVENLLKDDAFLFGGLNLNVSLSDVHITIAFSSRFHQMYEYNKLAPYSHPVIAEALNRQWFNSKRSEGAKMTTLFKPIPLTVIALIATAVSQQFN